MVSSERTRPVKLAFFLGGQGKGYKRNRFLQRGGNENRVVGMIASFQVEPFAICFLSSRARARFLRRCTLIEKGVCRQRYSLLNNWHDDERTCSLIARAAFSVP